jgi:hypothetical protein
MASSPPLFRRTVSLCQTMFGQARDVFLGISNVTHVFPHFVFPFCFAQVYRGNSFGDFFIGMSNATDKPVLLTEYGVDAYHDTCALHTLFTFYSHVFTPYSHPVHTPYSHCQTQPTSRCC